MVKLLDILQELYTGYPGSILSNNIKTGTRLKLYHASENKSLDLNRPIHLGTIDQADDRIDMLWNYSPIYYTFEVNITLTNPYPEILRDVDKGAGHTTSDFTKYGNYNEFIYHNAAEGFPEEKDNLSVFVINLKKSLISSKIVDITRTGE